MAEKLKTHHSYFGITARIVMLFASLVIVPFLVLACITFVFFRNYTVNQIGKATQDSLSVVGRQISDTLKLFEEESMSLYYNGYVEWILKEKRLTKEEQKLLEAELSAICFSNTGVHSAWVVTEHQEIFAGSYYRELPEVMEPYLEEIAAAGGAVCWYPTEEIRTQAGRPKYILARSLNSAKEKNTGYFYMVVDDAMVSDAFEQLEAEYLTKYLISETGSLYYSSNGEAFGQRMDLSAINPNVRADYLRAEWKGEKSVIVSRRLPATDWYCISVISMEDVMWNVYRLEFPFVIIAVIYVAFLALMLRSMNKYVFYPLRTLKQSMDQYARGNLEIADMKPMGAGEFKDLSEHFNSMTVRIDKLVKDYKEEVDEKNRQKMNALAAQLTPHFIYNALNTIKWMAVLNHQENIQRLTESLIHIFMNAARTDEDNYTLQDELELVKNYAVIQKARFMNFDLVIEAEKEALDCMIRKLILQPIVENAIVHGMKRGKIKNAQIWIRVWTDEDLHLTVKDEGAGFDVEKWRSCPDENREHTNIGLHNVEEILRLEYGGQYGLEIESIPGQGTTVTYLLPVRRKKEADDPNNYCG